MAEIVGIVAAGLQLGTLALKILSVTSALPGRVSSTDRIKTWTSEYLLLVVELKRLQCRMGESDPRVRHCQHEAKRLHSLLQLFCASPGAPRRAQLKNFALVLSEGSNLEKCISRLRDTLTLLKDPDLSNSVFSTCLQSEQFARLWHQLHENDATHTLLVVMVCYHNSPVPMNVLKVVLDGLLLHQTVQFLRYLGMAAITACGRRLSIHPVLRSLVIDEFGWMVERPYYLTLAMRAISTVFPAAVAERPRDRRSRMLCRHVHSVLMLVLQLPPSASCSLQAISLASLFLNHLLAMSLYTQAADLVYKLRIWQNRSAAGHMLSIALAEGEANVTARQGDLLTAQRLLRSLLRVHIQDLQNSVDDKDRIYNTIATVQGSLSHLRVAAKMHSEVLSSRETRFGASHPDTLLSMNNLGVTYLKLGRGFRTQAHELILQAHNAVLHTCSLNNQLVLAVRSNYGISLQMQGYLPEAEVLLEDVLDRRRVVLGPMHHETLKSEANLAIVINKRGRHSNAEMMLRRTLHMFERSFGAIHPDAIRIQSNIADTLHDQGRYSQAEAILAKTLLALRTQYEPGHRETLRALEHRAILLHHMRKLKDACDVAMELHSAQMLYLGSDDEATRRIKRYLKDLNVEIEVMGQRRLRRVGRVGVGVSV